MGIASKKQRWLTWHPNRLLPPLAWLPRLARLLAISEYVNISQLHLDENQVNLSSFSPLRSVTPPLRPLLRLTQASDRRFAMSL
jgi:hypothetical protein